MKMNNGKPIYTKKKKKTQKVNKQYAVKKSTETGSIKEEK